MAAYAALVSVMHIIEQIQNHPRPPIPLSEIQVRSLTKRVTFLQDFLERYSHVDSEQVNALESRIADAAYAAEDIIESHIVDQIKDRWEKISSVDFYKSLKRVIKDFDLIKREVMEIEQNDEIQNQLQRISLSASSLRPPSLGHIAMVGFDDVLIEVMDMLTAQQSNRHLIPIVGMGGIGKTTLARNVYVNPLIVQYFDFRGWAAISEEYNVKEILLELVLCLETKRDKESLSHTSEDELGEKVYKSLSGRRYLIVMDDMWSIEAWDKIKFFFPDNSNGSRIIITTRLSNLAFQLTGSHGLKMNFLNEDKSWDLLCKNLFGEQSCPLQLEDIGKKIARKCRGLPLSIVLIGGFLAKSQQTREHWEYIAENLNSIVNLDDNERCLKILNMSYNHLPVHLKPCFLYLGVFPEDAKIRVSKLIKLWVAEGFLKPIVGQTSEMTAEEYLNDLIDRNLVLVHKLGSSGKIKFCSMHDLLRDLCLRKAHKERFLIVAKMDNNFSQDISTQRRICLRYPDTIIPEIPSPSSPRYFSLGRDSLPLVRSLIGETDGFLPSVKMRLIRVWNVIDTKHRSCHHNFISREAVFKLANLRYLAIRLYCGRLNSFPSSTYRLWNVQTINFKFFESFSMSGFEYTPLFDIWKMPQIRHVKIDKLLLYDPPSHNIDGQDGFVLKNLHTLKKIKHFKCGDEVVNRIPNIKKLGIYYEEFEEWSSCCLYNIGRLHKLESLGCFFFSIKRPSRSYLVQNLVFPQSLKKLSLGGSGLNWEDMKKRIGALPFLQVLKLKMGSFIGSKWETVEGQFRSLKYLLIDDYSDLEHWTTESNHFPRLERIVLRGLRKLKEVSSEIGEIATLQSIELDNCSVSAVNSARKILEEQEELGNVGLQVRA